MPARATLFLALTFVAHAALAQAPGLPPMGPGAMPPPVKLTSKDVERLLTVIPVVAKEGAKHASKAPQAPIDPKNPPEEVKRIDALLKQHGLSMPEFAAQTATLVTTYLALSPEAFDAQLPSEKTPELARVLNDPKVPQEQKDALKAQIQAAQTNKEAIRTQLAQSATDENKTVVKPYLAKIKSALDAAQAEAKKAGVGPRL